MVRRIPPIVRKNSQIFLNSKASSIMLVVGPIILICLIGFALQNTSLKNVKAGVYENQSSGFSNILVQKLKDKSFNVSIENNLQKCENEVVQGTKDVCISVSKTPLTAGYYKYNLNSYVDLSKQRTVWQIIGALQGIASEASSNERQSIAKDMKAELESVSSQLSDEEAKIDLAISDVDYAQTLLSESASQQNSARNLIGNSESEISSVLSTLQEIESSNSVPQQYSLDLSNSISAINQVNSNLQTVQSNLNSQNYNSIQNQINLLSSELYTARDSIQQVQNNINQIENVNINGVSEPVTLSYQSVTNSGSGTVKKDLQMIDYLFPTFLLFFILFGATIFSSISRFRERKSGAYIRNILSKAKGPEFVFGDFLLSLAIVAIQVVIITYIASFFLNISIFQNILSLIITLLLAISIFVLVGIVIGSALNSQESIVIGAVSISVLFFIFTSIIVPVETLPPAFASIVSILPLTLLEAKLRAILIFGINLHFSLKQALSIAGSYVVTIGLTAIFYIKNKRKEV